MWLKRLQLALIHTAVAIALVPFGSLLNRVMIVEMGIAATVYTILFVLPYVFSPIQIAIGSYADRHPILGLRRTPYIVIGLSLCLSGVFLAPFVVSLIASQGWTALTIILAVLIFGAWGMGFNFASVSYLSLASELDEIGRSHTIAYMFFVMIIGIIITGIALGRIVEVYSFAALQRAFWSVGIVALIMGVLGLIRLEPRSSNIPTEQRYSIGEMYGAVTRNPQARLFFIYIILLLAAILGQDVLLEPFGAHAFDLPVDVTVRFNSIWGTCMLITLVLAGFIQRRISKLGVARIGAWGALIGFLLIAISGFTHSLSIFYTGLALHGLGTGLSTVSNLSLMLDMTTPQNVGLFIGAWGMANALSRLAGPLMSAVVRDVSDAAIGTNVLPYVVVFLLEALFLFISLLILGRIDVRAFQTASAAANGSLIEHAALMGEASGD